MHDTVYRKYRITANIMTKIDSVTIYVPEYISILHFSPCRFTLIIMATLSTR